jgi:hypothetical protein
MKPVLASPSVMTTAKFAFFRQKSYSALIMSELARYFTYRPLMGGCGSGFQLPLRKQHWAAHFGRRLVRAETFIDDLAQQIVVGPS